MTSKQANLPFGDLVINVQRCQNIVFYSNKLNFLHAKVLPFLDVLKVQRLYFGNV